MSPSKAGLAASLFFLTELLAGSTVSQAKKPLSEYAAVFDLGSIPLTEEATHDFPVVNSSQKQLKVEDIESSCECLKIVSFPDEVPPQSEKPFKLKLIPPKPGEFAYEASLTLNDKSVKKYLLMGTIEDKEKMVNPEFWISLSEAKNLYTKNHQEIHWIDVRSSEKYRALRIPDSLNIPIYNIKTKPFLKGKKLILITQGYEYGIYVQELEKIRKADFDARFLKGGLLGWLSDKGEVLGNSTTGLDILSPLEFFSEKEYGYWIKIDCDDVKISTPCHLITHAEHVPGSLSKEAFQSKVHELKLKIQGGSHKEIWVNLLLFNKDGDYGKVREKLGQFPGMNLFFLEGGLTAYEKFLQDKEASLNARSVTRKMKACRGCP